MSAGRERRRSRRAAPGRFRQVIGDTLSACLRYRVLGLSAEAAFFTILSFPPLLFALTGSIGFVAARIDPGALGQFRMQLLQLAGQALTPETVDSLIRPTLEEVLGGGRADVLLLGFLIALWSGSRALQVFIETIAIMYGHGGHRRLLVTIALSFVLCLILLLLAAVLIPLVLTGPAIVERMLPAELGWLNNLYWPIVVCGSALFLAALYSVSIPRGYRLRSTVPGAALALLIWVGGSGALRYALSLSLGSPTIYGPLAAPIALLLWIYVISLAVLVGAAMNAALAAGPDSSDADGS